MRPNLIGAAQERSSAVSKPAPYVTFIHGPSSLTKEPRRLGNEPEQSVQLDFALHLDSSMAPLQFLLLGTGTSTALPLTPCLTRSMAYPEAFTSHVPSPSAPPSAPGGHIAPGFYDPNGPYPKNVQCASCRSAVDPDVPEGWKNKRGNTSGLVRRKGADGRWLNILVDCGKTFLEAARTQFPRWGVQTIDAVLLTHGHADAYFGLDDLREWCVRQRCSIPIYLDQATYGNVAASFPYLVDKKRVTGGGDV